MATRDELEVQATSEIEAAKPINKSENGVVSEFSDADYAQAITDLTNSKWDNQENGWLYARKAAYPSIGDQLDMQYHDAVDGTTTWKNAIKSVKDKHPKT